jgi:hypothetical protein
MSWSGQEVLTAALRGLERGGLVERRISAKSRRATSTCFLLCRAPEAPLQAAR